MIEGVVAATTIVMTAAVVGTAVVANERNGIRRGMVRRTNLPNMVAEAVAAAVVIETGGVAVAREGMEKSDGGTMKEVVAERVMITGAMKEETGAIKRGVENLPIGERMEKKVGVTVAIGRWMMA